MNMFAEEKIQLALDMRKMKHSYETLAHQLQRYDEQYDELKVYLADSYNEIDSMEIFSNQQALTRIDQTALMTLKQITKLEKMMQSPYFSRIDFIFEGETEAQTERIYIGRFSYTDELGNIVVHDWRAPISNMYYEFELGPAHYEAHHQSIHGEITKRRGIKIEHGELEYVVEHAMTINDSVLQQELSKNADHKMKTIISTIQKEQNAIIREELAHTLVIQGVAGSGKTSIALHRVAYLLYKYKDILTPDTVMIISPNKVFASYISTVLPELGEDPIVEASIEELVRELVKGKLTFASSYEQTKSIIEQPNGELAKRAAFKCSLSFYEQFIAYLAKQDQKLMMGKELTISGVTITGDDIAERFQRYHKHSVAKRIQYIADDILALIIAKPVSAALSAAKKRSLKTEIHKSLKQRLQQVDAFSIYRGFYEDIQQPEMLYSKKGKMEFSDLFPYLMCVDYMEGVEAYTYIKHLVIDEMQDYTPVQFAVLQKLFPCQKTILGDLSQSMNPYAIASSSIFRKIFGNHQFVELNKSYRSSYNIIEFAKQFLPHNSIEAVERYGKAPAIMPYSNDGMMLEQIRTHLQKFKHGEHKTCGILCKTEAQLTRLYETLQFEFELTKLDEHSFTFQSGITITSIALAKGLEFDSVLVPYVDQETYRDSYDKNLLYISCTRALHELVLFVDQEQPSPLLRRSS